MTSLPVPIFLTQHPDHILSVKCSCLVRNLTITQITSLEYLKMDGDIAASLPKKVKTHAAKIIAGHSE